MAINVHLHPKLDGLPKFSFNAPTEKEKSSTQPEDKHSMDGEEANHTDAKNEEKSEPVEENNETLNTLINVGITIAVIAVTIPIATWLFKQTSGLIREARGVGKAIAGG